MSNLQIHQVEFSNSFVDELRGEVAPDKRPRQVPGYCYSRIEPTPVRDPHLLAWSDDFAAYLGLARPEERGPAVDVLAGNLVTDSMKPFAARYAGHQFGNWAGQLGDGRAISLGEVTATDGSSWEIQLKGAGPTPYSRRADGRAVLRSSLREFLCSEAMHYLGVPTTRALSLVGTGDTVIRDMFYSGDPRPEPGAIVARVAPTAEGLKVDFGSREAWPNIRWKAPEGIGWDWSKYEALVLTLANPSKENIPFHVKINDVGKDGKKHAAQMSGNAPAGQTRRFFVSLESRALREKSMMRYLPPVQGDYGTRLGTGVEPGHIEELQVFRSRPSQPATLLIKSITLEGQAKTLDLNNIVDQYGQYTRADWPGKVKSDADLLAQKTAEAADLKAHPPLSNRSKWGGWTDGPRQQATGFFRTQKMDGKWWLVDPDGYLFLSVGVDVVHAPANNTRVKGREYMFTWLPDANDPLARYYGGGSNEPQRDYNFLLANLARKFGADAETGFGARAVERLKSWGFNTLGNWSPERIGREQRFPYVVAVGTRGGFATVPGHKGHKMPDPFDPAFARDVEANLAPKAALAKDDPAVIGYFFDNELPWGMPGVDEERYVLCYGALALGENSPAKRAFVDLLKTRYESIAAFNTAWKTSFASWDELMKPFKTSTPVKSDAQRQDFSAFLTIYADKYFETVAGAIKRHDPNHLYLGCRFAFWFTEEAVRSSAKYSDAISFNVYNWNPNTYRFAQNLGKPCIIGEFHFGATDRGMFSGNVTVKDQQARGESYANYVQAVLSEPGFVGCHWFQFYDQPVTGRGQDGENFNIGFASVTDTPHTELIAAARVANARIYRWHAAAGSTSTAP